METSDMDLVRSVTPYVTGISEEKEVQEILHQLPLMVCLWG